MGNNNLWKQVSSLRSPTQKNTVQAHTYKSDAQIQISKTGETSWVAVITHCRRRYPLRRPRLQKCSSCVYDGEWVPPLRPALPQPQPLQHPPQLHQLPPAPVDDMAFPVIHSAHTSDMHAVITEIFEMTHVSLKRRPRGEIKRFG